MTKAQLTWLPRIQVANRVRGVRRSLVRHIWLEAAVASLVATLLLFGDVLAPHARDVLSSYGEDLTRQYFSWRSFAASELRHGNLPFWNPYAFGGAPFLGGFQAGLLYPLNVIYLCLPLRLAINLEIAVHVCLAGFFTWVWARRRGISPAGARVAGAMFAFSAPFLAHVYPGHLSNLATMAWMPALFLAVDALLEEPSILRVVAGALVAAVEVLAGHPQYVFYAALMGVPYVLVHLREAPHPLKSCSALALTGVLGASLAAAQLAAGFDAISETHRARSDAFAFASSFHLHATHLATLLSPLVYGGPLGVHYWGIDNFWELNIYIGVVGFVLMIAGATAWTKGANRRLAMLALVALLLAFGSATPLYRLLYDYVPGINMFRGISKFVIFFSLFGAPLAGAGLDRLATLGARPRRAIGLAALGVGLLLTLTSSWYVANAATRPDAWARLGILAIRGQSPDAPPVAAAGVVATQTVVGSMMIAGALLLAFGAACVRTSRRRLASCVAFLAVAELFGMAWVWRPKQSYAAIIDDVRSLAAVRGAAPPDERFFDPDLPNGGMLIGRSSLWGSDPFVLSRYAELVAEAEGVTPEQLLDDSNFKVTSGGGDLWRLLRAHPPDEAAGAPPPLPRFSVIGRYEVAHGRDDVLAALHRVDPRRTVILEAEPSPRPEPGGPPAKIEVLHETSDAIDVRVTTDRPGILLVTDPYSVGWQAVGLGRQSAAPSYQTLPADYALRAVPLGAGTQSLRLFYRPPHWRVGVSINVAALAVTAGLIAWHVRRRRSLGAERRPACAQA